MSRNLALSTLLLVAAATSVVVNAQTVTAPTAIGQCCRPSQSNHFWQCELPVVHSGAGNLLLPLSDNVTTANGVPGVIIEDSKILVITDVFLTNTNEAGWTPSLVRASQVTGAWEYVLQGPTAQKGWAAGGRGGRIVQPDEQQAVGLALRPTAGSSGSQWEGTVSISGYWIVR